MPAEQPDPSALAALRRRALSVLSSLPPDALELADAFITKGEPPEILIEKIEQLM